MQVQSLQRQLDTQTALVQLVASSSPIVALVVLPCPQREASSAGCSACLLPTARLLVTATDVRSRACQEMQCAGTCGLMIWLAAAVPVPSLAGVRYPPVALTMARLVGAKDARHAVS